MKSEPIEFANQTNAIVYKLGLLSGDVRILKWLGTIGITLVVASLGYIAQQVGALQTGQVEILERLAKIEQRVENNENQIRTHSH